MEFSDPKTLAGSELKPGRHEFVVQCEVETLERMRKVARAGPFTFYCDEGESLGGDNSAPYPLMYLAASLGF